MAIQKITKDGYGQIELNQVAFRRDGRIQAQARLDATEFANEKPAENGTLFAVNDTTKTLTHATQAQEAIMPIGINYSSEIIYDERTRGLKNFFLTIGRELPRIGYLSIGDRFTTNAVAFDDTEFTDEETLNTALENISTTPMYGGINDDAEGYITLSATIPATGLALRVAEKTTMPDSQPAIKFVVVRV